MKTQEKVYCKECGRLVGKKGYCDRCQKDMRPVSMRRVIKLQR